MSSLPTYTSFEDSTREDWQNIIQEQAGMFAGLPDRIIAHLLLLKGDHGGFPVDRLDHCLQTATLAHQAGEDEEYVVCALLHDIGDTLATMNHAELAATILQPFVSEENYWMVKHHGIFQGFYFFHHLDMDRNARDQYRDHPCFERTAHFCQAYDNRAFDPECETLPLDFFIPMIKRLFSAPKVSLYKSVLD